MKQLSGLDSAFLYLETDNAPMHIGGVSILDPRTPDGRFTLDTLRQVLAARLDRSRPFTERLASVPWNLGKPYWVEDESFDLDRHLERTQLPEPGGWRELSALTAWELGQPLPRDRPLWKMLLVEGVDGIVNEGVLVIPEGRTMTALDTFRIRGNGGVIRLDGDDARCNYVLFYKRG